MTPQSNYPTLTALFADMAIIAREALEARQAVTIDDFRRAGLTSNGVVLDATEGVRRAFNDIEIRDFAGRIIARAFEEHHAAKNPAAALAQTADIIANGVPKKEIARRFYAPLQAMRADADAADGCGKARNVALAVCGLSLGAAICLATANAVGI